MSTNGANVEDTEMAECEGEKVVTMMDVLQEQQEFEEDANAVLGASDDKNCTYSKGYIKRQAVYACLTCCNEAKDDPDKRAGVCLACSLTCHENHDLVELYTKRNFRCDCGNPKFNHPCQYTENKMTLNDENIYNQNFSGLYCTCHRPYPDPDGVEEEMIQCIVCEDWLHASHLEATVPSSELYAEMVCKACMDKNEFLHDYSKYAINGDVDVVDTSDIMESSVQCNGDSNKINGVDTKMDVEKTETEERSVSDEMEKDIPTETMNTSHDNIEENKPEEQMQPNVSVSMTTDNEKIEENKTEHTDHIVSEKTGDENPTEDNVAKDIVTDKSDNANLIKENLAKDIVTDKSNNANPIEENLAKDIVTDKSDNADPIEENLDIVKDKSNNANPIEENLAKDIVTDKSDNANPIEENLAKDIVTDKSNNANPTEENKAKDTNEEDTPTNNETSDNKLGDNLDSAVASRDQENLEETNNKVDGITDVTDVNITEQENQPNVPRESNGNDASDDQKVDDKTDEDLKIDSLKKQAVPSDSTLTSDADKNVEPEEVTENHLADEIKENKRKLSTEESTLDISAKKPKLSESDCLRPQTQKKMFKGATFWPCHFRQKLCTCNECITMYKDLSVLFLTDLEDTVTAYEVLGKEKTDGAASTQYEKGLEALSSLGRIQQINALTEYNRMRDKLIDFLKNFKDRKEVVKEEDIKAFFAGMKPKREPDGVYFCR